MTIRRYLQRKRIIITDISTSDVAWVPESVHCWIELHILSFGLSSSSTFFPSPRRYVYFKFKTEFQRPKTMHLMLKHCMLPLFYMFKVIGVSYICLRQLTHLKLQNVEEQLKNSVNYPFKNYQISQINNKVHIWIWTT